jgi:hypothetical protein
VLVMVLFGVEVVVDCAFCDNEATPIAVELGDPEVTDVADREPKLAIFDEVAGARAPPVEYASNAEEIPARFP